MRGFSDEERKRIRVALKESGRELFAQYGLGRTTVAELTGPVGIGTSTVYQFYDSKDDPSLAILEDEEAAIAGAISAVVFITLHQEDIGENYAAVRDELVARVADGLVAERAWPRSRTTRLRNRGESPTSTLPTLCVDG